VVLRYPGRPVNYYGVQKKAKNDQPASQPVVYLRGTGDAGDAGLRGRGGRGGAGLPLA
jgi:hypothetical protein